MTLKRRGAKAVVQPKSESTKVAYKQPETANKDATTKAARPSSVAFLLAQMLFCLIGINLCFGWWSVKQERVVKKPYILSLTHNDADSGSEGEKVYLTTAYGLMLSQTMTGCLVSATLLGFHKLFRWSTHPERNEPVSASSSGASTGTANGKGSSAAAANRQGAQSTLGLKDVPELLAMGFSSIFGSSLGYAGMRRLSYPVALTAKMCKMLPVMLIGAVWHRNTYPARKVLSCLVITAGVVVFALLDQRSNSKPAAGKSNKTVDRLATSSSSLVGMVLVVINLLMDGYTNSTQDVLVKRHGWSGPSLMLWANAVSFCCALFVLSLLEFGEQPWTWLCAFLDQALTSVWRGAAAAGGGEVHVATASLAYVPFHDLSHYVAFLARSVEARHDVLLMSMLNSLGQLFIFHTISLFGALAVTAMTLLRKVGSVLLSIYVHGHPVQPSQGAALAVIFAGIISEGYINVQDASRRQRERLAASTPAEKTFERDARLPAGKAGASAKGRGTATQAVPPTTTTPFTISSSSSSTAMMTDSRSATPMCAPT